MRRLTVLALGALLATLAPTSVTAAPGTVRISLVNDHANVNGSLPIRLRWYVPEADIFTDVNPVVNGYHDTSILLAYGYTGPSWWEITLQLANGRSWQFATRSWSDELNRGEEALSRIVEVRGRDQTYGTFRGRWLTVDRASSTHGTHRTSTQKGASFAFSFRGTEAVVVVDESSTGRVAVYVDGKRKGTLSLSRTAAGWRLTKRVARFDRDGLHRVKLVLLSGRIRVDGFGSIATRTSHRAPSPCMNTYLVECILPPPARRSCSDIDAREFPWWFRDPHGFDADGDGTACETPYGN
jgi:hypothetical protein